MGLDEKKTRKFYKISCSCRITPKVGMSWGIFAYNKDHQFKYFQAYFGNP